MFVCIVFMLECCKRSKILINFISFIVVYIIKLYGVYYNVCVLFWYICMCMCVYVCVLSKGLVINMYIFIYVCLKISNGYIVFVKGYIFVVWISFLFILFDF